MKFGKAKVEEAEGAVLAHSVHAGSLRLRKAHIVTRADIAALKAAGVDDIVIARLSPGEIGEDDAATRLAAALQVEGVEVKGAATGRVNLHATADGVFTVDRELVDAFNAVDPAITLATVSPHETVRAGQMVATVKIIPFAVPGTLVEKTADAVSGGLAFSVHPFRALRVGMIQTVLPGTKASILDKTRQLTEARLARSGSRIVDEKRVAHEDGAVAAAIGELGPACDLLVLFGASAVSDADDVLPSAIRMAGGHVERVGMPVDPGNLLVLGSIGAVPVIGAPGCARSPRPNGFDWVLDRVSAGVEVWSADIAAMGVGGLLMEIASRPQPRDVTRPTMRKVGAVLLAAGRSSRMGGPNKLLARFDGVPLVRRTAERLAASAAGPRVAVIGHQADRMREALDGIEMAIVENPNYASGLASSLKKAIQALPGGLDGVMIVLADMPNVETADFDRLIAAFRQHNAAAAVRATAGGKRGNPVILPASLVARIDELDGDTGARHLVEAGGVEVVDVELGEAARLDVDTPDALAAAGGRIVD